MPEQNNHPIVSVRKLAAIMFTDIAGYTALMDKDEDVAFDLLQKNRSIHKPLIEIFRGKFLKEIGDGILASFSTVSDAVYCAGAIQKACENEPDLKLRIGIHQGEVVSHGDDVFGSGVNIASRIEAITPVGGIWVSDSVQRNIQNKKGIIIEFVKEETLKNVKQPVRIYDIKVDEKYTSVSDPNQRAMDLDSSKASEKSIAILPFVNMSNDPDQEYFCDGLSEELLNVLAQLGKIKVAARTSSFMFKGQNRDITEIGKKLNVNTVLEGSVRKSGNRIRITTQLINVQNGFHLWSEKYDREIADIFDIQAEIALAILKELRIKLLGEEKSNLLKRNIENTDAYQYYLKGRFNFHRCDGAGWLTAIKYYKKALEIEPDYAKAHAGNASAYLNLWHFSILTPENSFNQMKESTFKALELDDQIAESHYAMARYKFWHDFDLKGAEKEFLETIRINPNIPEALSHYGFVQNFLGHREKALEFVRKAKDLDPFSPMNSLDLIANLWVAGKYDEMLLECNNTIKIIPQFWGSYWYTMHYHWIKGDYDKAMEYCKKADSLFHGQLTLSYLGCLYGLTGQHEKARRILAELEKLAIKEHVGSYYFAILYSGMNDMDKTFHYLDIAGKERTGLLIFLDCLARNMISFIKKDQRYKPYLAGVGIPPCLHQD
jgi:TolB-like protein/Tfp pilus assembly protein PilF